MKQFFFLEFSQFLQSKFVSGLDVSTLEPSETECKTKSEEIIFEHIRKKSKSFPTLLTSTVMDYACRPLVLRRDTSKKQGFDVEADLNHIILIDSDPSEVSQELSLPVSFPTETERAVTTSKLNSVLKPQLPHKLSPTCHQPGCNKPCSDSLEIVQTVGCKRSFSNESNPISDSPNCSRGHSVSVHDNLRAESFLGFKSVFSFL